MSANWQKKRENNLGFVPQSDFILAVVPQSENNLGINPHTGLGINPHVNLAVIPVPHWQSYLNFIESLRKLVCSLTAKIEEVKSYLPRIFTIYCTCSIASVAGIERYYFKDRVQTKH